MLSQYTDQNYTIKILRKKFEKKKISGEILKL